MNWQADLDRWKQVSRCLASDGADAGLRLVILAAHPDDETIGASRLLGRFRQSYVVFLTDGAPRDSSLWPAGVHGPREEYHQMRREEAQRALRHVGMSEKNILWLGGVDQEAVYESLALAERFREILSELRPSLIVTHSYEGGHPDHDAAALAARIASTRLDARRPPLILEMTSYHARKGRLVTGRFLENRVQPELVLELSREDRERKRRMIDAYSSQRLVLESFSVDSERLRPAPEYDFSRPPHPGKLWYESMGWAMTGGRWRELAGAALLEHPEHA
jgi:N-acetylglucosamine malate deacetylase 2